MVDLHVERRVEGASRRKLRVTAWVMSCNRRSAGVGVRKWVQIQCFELEVTVYTQMEMIKRQLETWALGQGWVHLQLGIWEFEFEIWVWDWKKSLSSSSEVKARHGARVDSLFGHRYVRGVRNAGPDFWKTLWFLPLPLVSLLQLLSHLYLEKWGPQFSKSRVPISFLKQTALSTFSIGTELFQSHFHLLDDICSFFFLSTYV